MKEAGCNPDTRFALHDVGEKKKAVHLCWHSEKLAIAFGLIKTPAGAPVRIAKNLWVSLNSADFKHRWLHNRLNPLWMKSETASVVPVTSQVNIKWGEDLLGPRNKIRELWQKFFADPSQWWDNTPEKDDPKFPDFKHKHTQDALWLVDGRNPSWVASKVALIPPGILQKNVFSWTRKLSRCNKAEQYEMTLELFRQFQREGIAADRFVFVPVLKACTALQILHEGRHIHAQIIKAGCESDLYVSSCLVDMYAKCRSIDDAVGVFNKMPKRDVVAWNAMILGHVNCGQGLMALKLFQQMHREGIQPDCVTFVGLLNACASVAALEEGRHVHGQIRRGGYECDVYVGNSLIDMYTKCASIEDAIIVFNKMPTRDVITWTTMILGFVSCGQGLRALGLFEQMQLTRVQPDSVAFVGLLNACASIAALEKGRQVHAQIKQSGCEFDLYLANSLVEMYSKCGSIEDALMVFNTMPTRDVVSWTTMIGGYSIHGRASEAIALFEQMCIKGLDVNAVTLVCLFSACSHGGLVKEGLHYFELMMSVYGVSPNVEHYICMVDLLGRAGRLDDALNMVKTMPLEPDAGVWMSLLGACRVHGNIEIGERAAQRVLELDPENTTSYVLLSNLYAAASHWDRC